MKKNKVTYLDLFAGLGGIRLGFSQGFKNYSVDTTCIFSSEIKKHAVTVYKNYFGDNNIAGDIKKIPPEELPNFDYLLAGFPCQPFSSAGARRGFLDTRGTLFFEIEKILRHKIITDHPARGFLLENVEGLVNHDNGRTLKTILSKLRKLGYFVSWRVLDARYFGVPQARKRIYIVGSLNCKISLNNFEQTTTYLKDVIDYGLPICKTQFTNSLLKTYTIKELIGKSIKDKRGGKNNIHSWDIELRGETNKQERELLSLLLKERRKKHWASEIGIDWMDGMPLTIAQIRTFFDTPNLKGILRKLTKQGYLSYEYPKKLIIKKNGTKSRVYDTTLAKGYNIVAGKLSFEFSEILDPNKTAPTLVATDVDKLGVVDGSGIRHLTIKECQRLFGYPDDYDLSIIKTREAYDLLGNTVCVPVIAKIAERMAEEWVDNH